MAENSLCNLQKQSELSSFSTACSSNESPPQFVQIVDHLKHYQEDTFVSVDDDELVIPASNPTNHVGFREIPEFAPIEASASASSSASIFGNDDEVVTPATNPSNHDMNFLEFSEISPIEVSAPVILSNEEVGFHEISEISPIEVSAPMILSNKEVGFHEISEISPIKVSAPVSLSNGEVGLHGTGELSPTEAPIVGNGCEKFKKMMLEPDAKKEKRSRRKGKNSKNKNGNGKEGCVKIVREETAFDKKRKEMEALRFVDVQKQNKKWLEIYCGLEPTVAKEYDALIWGSSYDDHNAVNFDPRQQFLKNKAPDLGKASENMCHLDPGCGLGGNDIVDDPDVLEDCNEDDDSDADYTSIHRPAFMVTGEPNFDSGPPQDGLEYLRRVRWEAEQIPRVKVARVEKSKLNKEQTVYMPNIPGIAECPEHLIPSKQWEDVFLREFSELRLALSLQSVPIVLEECSQNLLDGIILEKLDNLTSDRIDSCQSDGKSIQSSSNVDEGDTSQSAASPKSCVNGVSDEWPSLSTISGMNSVTRASTLKKRVKLVESMSSVSKNEYAWLFALCAAVDTPLDADMSAALRCLLRKCASLRAEKSELDDEVIMLNILATISGKYFRQSEI